jgi:tetratricopeptide (TPR) repeat protein
MTMRLLALLFLAGCPKGGPAVPAGGPSQEIDEGLPGWMTRGEEAQIAVVEELLESGNTVGALDVLRQMRAKGNNSPTVDLLQGKALRIDGVTTEAERMLLAAQKKLTRDARPSSELCILYADLHQLEQAVAACQRATEIDRNAPKAWNNLGFLLLASERPDEALQAAERAIELDGGEPRYRNNLAMAQAALGREDIAFRTLQSTMSKADAAYMVGVVLERFERTEPAQIWYERALQYDPTHREAQQAKAPAGSPALPAPEPVETP